MGGRAALDGPKPGAARGLRRCIAALSLACAAFAAAGEPLAFAVARLPLSLPVYVAQDRGFFAEEGATVNVADCDIGRRCLERMLAGGADLATAANLPVVVASLQGQRFTIVASMASSRNDTKIVTRRGSGIDSAAALAGRRVGTFVGTSRFLQGVKPDVRVFSVQPDSPFHGLEGLKHMDTAIVPPIYDPALATANVEAPTEAAYEMVRRLAKRDGLLVGPSSAAAVWACVQVARGLDRGVVVTILCDAGTRYLSEPHIWRG